MEKQNATQKGKGGRPEKAVKRNKIIALKCTADERNSIIQRAATVHLTVSEFLRELALTGKIEGRKKALPPEVLRLTSTMNHLAANLNQIARRRNTNDELSAVERATLEVQSRQLKELVSQVKNYLL